MSKLPSGGQECINIDVARLSLRSRGQVLAWGGSLAGSSPKFKVSNADIYPESICETEKGCLQIPVLPGKSELLSSGKEIKDMLTANTRHLLKRGSAGCVGHSRSPKGDTGPGRWMQALMQNHRSCSPGETPIP